MKVQIRIETEFGWGQRRSHEVGTVERDSIQVSEGDLGLSLAEGKSILRDIQQALL